MTNNAFSKPIVTFGTERQKEYWLRRICSEDDFLVAFAATEPQSGSDALSPDPKAGIMTRTDLSKPPIESLACFLVPGDARGLKTGRIENKLGHKLCRTAEIILEDVEIPEENLLGGGRRSIHLK